MNAFEVTGIIGLVTTINTQTPSVSTFLFPVFACIYIALLSKMLSKIHSNIKDTLTCGQHEQRVELSTPMITLSKYFEFNRN